MADIEQTYLIEFVKWNDSLKNALEKAKEKRNTDGEFCGGDLSGRDYYEGAAVQTSEGIVPLHESGLPSFNFKFWVGHTNFNLTAATIEAIINTLGVETFEQNTPLRFRIAVGRLFNEKDTLERIKANVYQVLGVHNNPLNNYELLRKQFKFFAVINQKVLGGNTQEEVEEKIKLFKDKIETSFFSWKN